MRRIWLVVLFILACHISCQEEKNKCDRMNFLPMPVDLKCGNGKLEVADPCKILFHVKIDRAKNDHVA
jgi:hypothetical protein